MIKKERLVGLEAPYEESEIARQSLRYILKQRIYIGLVILLMMVVNCILIVGEMIAEQNSIIPILIIIITNLVVLTLLITSNEKIKSIIQSDLEKQNRKNEAKKVKVKYENEDKLTMFFCVVILITQSINTFM
ncbi:hypothetical protein BUZ69_11950 [Staphylococcus saprophyticus]|uniref:hypothetical protein n=1 Tax=Staphylococcus saprophyticus TaxID=29385 RepID=UPI000D1E10AF|nr:hypothetical protein [Staphylococcus saprophyticus]PTK45042.1 hypothetical protein BUZ69_11950 [Staphylococcus saprophyticus]